MLKIKDLQKSDKIMILGFWKEWVSAYNFLIKQGFQNIYIWDKNPQISWPISEVHRLKLWTSYLDDLGSFKLIVKTPWISSYDPQLIQHQKKIITTTQIFFEYYIWKVIGITGTKWKSTVSSLLYHCLKNSWYKVILVWNIWKAVIDEIDVHNDDYDYVIYEISSYMLDWFSPDLYIWYINNVFPCHLDWHISMENYTQAKYNILTHAEHTIVHSSLKYGWLSFWNKDAYYFIDWSIYNGSSIFIKNVDTHLIWENNMTNICWVVTILSLIIQKESILKKTLIKTLKDFQALPHRLQNLWIYWGITFIDDGAAVTPEATCWAIRTIGKNISTLFIGWKNHGRSQSEIEKLILFYKISNLVLFPDSGYTIFADKVKDISPNEVSSIKVDTHTIKVLKTTSMQQGVQFAYKYTEIGKTVLLSSAAQSYSLWDSFEQKWNEYLKNIKKHAAI